MRFTADNASFLLDNEPFYLYSGEIHYFRIKKKLWPLHLKKLKDANCRFVSTYIPWGWHEYEEGKFLSRPILWSDVNAAESPESHYLHRPTCSIIT